MPIFKERCENLNIQKVAVEKLNPAKYNPRKDLKPGDPEYERLKLLLQIGKSDISLFLTAKANPNQLWNEGSLIL